MPDPSPADWLSDAEAEAMDRARDPEFWDRIDRLRRVGAAAQAHGLTAEALAAIHALDAAGFVIAPKEPTEAMIDAAGRATGYEGMAVLIYRAMISARPSASGEG